MNATDYAAQAHRLYKEHRMSSVQRNEDGDTYEPSSYRFSEVPDSEPGINLWFGLGIIAILVLVAGLKVLA